MKIRKWILLVALVLSVAMATTGTLAYLTDRDSEANVFTMGNVDIDLEESWDDKEEHEILPGETEDKQAWIENVGPNDAYVWATVAVPAELEEALIITRGDDARWDWENATVKQEEIDGVVCNVYTVRYTEVLPSGEKTPNIITELGLSSAVDVDPEGNMHLIVNGEEKELDLGWNVLEDGLESVVYVSAYAIQTEGFENFDEAYAAYYSQWGNNGTYYEDPNAPTHICWDGTADTSWYNDTDTEFVLTTAEQLAGLADLVDDGNTFEGKTVKLGADMCLGCEVTYTEDTLPSFDPIGYGYNVVFKGTFDGQGHTIEHLNQNGWALGLDYSTEGGGLFASVVDATFKNLTIDNAEVVMECIDMGVLVGYSYGDCTYENITIQNSTIANYQRYTGGVVGEINGKQTFKNVDVKDTVISSLWGDFDCSLGGIIGGKWGDAEVYMEDCDVECEINAYNDVTSSYQWYAYRRAGMLIGNSEETKTEDGRTSATASYLTAKNCTVTYGDWANYTYCEFAGTNWPYVRVQEGYSCSAYSNPRYGVATDANGNKVVNDTHVHNEGEDHNILLAFNQLFGGGQGVYGTETHDGVTIK